MHPVYPRKQAWKNMDSTAHCCWFRFISPFPLITGLCDERGHPCIVPNPRGNILLFTVDVQFSQSVVSNSVTHELQHARLPCPLPTPQTCSNSCPSSWWWHPTISSSAVPFSSCSQSFPASGSFQMSQLFISGGQSIGVSPSTSALPVNTQDWSPLGWTGWISLQSKELSRVFCNTTIWKHQFFSSTKI